MKRKKQNLSGSFQKPNGIYSFGINEKRWSIQKETFDKKSIFVAQQLFVPAEKRHVRTFCLFLLIGLAGFFFCGFFIGQVTSVCRAEEGFSLKLQKSSEGNGQSENSGLSLEINIPQRQETADGPTPLKNNQNSGNSVPTGASDNSDINGNTGENGSNESFDKNGENKSNGESGKINHQKSFKVAGKNDHALESEEVTSEEDEEAEEGFFRSKSAKKSGVNKKTLFMQWKQERREAFKLRKKQDQATKGDRFMQDPPVEISNFTAKESVWGRFTPGSWCRIRTTSKAFKNFKPIRSITETTLTLESVDEAGYVLKKETAIIVGPNMLKRDPEYTRYDFWDVPISDGAQIEDGGTVCLLISQKATPCKIRRILRRTDQYQEEAMLYYSQVTAPHILKKEIKRFAPEEDLTQNMSATPLNSSIMMVQKTAAHVFLGRKFSNYRSHTITRQGTSVKLTVTEHNSDIPGGVSKELITERDTGERLLYQATSIISEFHIEK